MRTGPYSTQSNGVGVDYTLPAIAKPEARPRQLQNAVFSKAGRLLWLLPIFSTPLGTKVLPWVMGMPQTVQMPGVQFNRDATTAAKLGERALAVPAEPTPDETAPSANSDQWGRP